LKKFKAGSTPVSRNRAALTVQIRYCRLRDLARGNRSSRGGTEEMCKSLRAGAVQIEPFVARNVPGTSAFYAHGSMKNTGENRKKIGLLCPVEDGKLSLGILKWELRK
jgi:hypothetical protein